MLVRLKQCSRDLKRHFSICTIEILSFTFLLSDIHNLLPKNIQDMNKKRLKKCFCKYRLRTKLQCTYHRISQRLYPNSSDKPKDPWYQSHRMSICSILPKFNHILTLFSIIEDSHCKISTIYPDIGKHTETSPRRQHIISSYL